MVDNLSSYQSKIEGKSLDKLLTNSPTTFKTGHCSLCNKELSDSWLCVVPDDGEEHYLCGDCLWKALLGGHMYIKNIEKGRELYGEE